MVSGRTSSLGKQLRRIVIAADAVGLSDADLLDSFVTGGEEAAFEALVRRHGPMVMGVCRRVLHDPHEADDAFQATFVVLLRKCQSLAQPELLGNWLYGVAFRTAREVRNRAARRRARELQAPPAEAAAPASEWDDVRPVLDEELNKLPTKYRLPVVLCDLQSKSRKEVARQIGCPEGTLSSRLARAHDLLRRRLLRRGLVLSAGGLAVGLSAEVASAALLPPTLVVNTVKAALAVAVADAVGVGALSAPVAALVEGVMQTMFLAKVKVTAAVLLTVGLVGTSIGMLTHRALADRPGAAAAEREQPTGPRVQGIVKSVDAERNSVTVTVRHEDGKPADHTVAVPKDAKIVLMKGAGALSDLRPQMAVRVQLSADEKSVVAIQELARGEEAGRDGQPGRDGVGRPGEPGRAGREEERPNLVGQVKAVDADQRTITITIRRDGQQPEDQTLAVAANASVVVPTKEAARLGDVQVGMRVALSLEAGKQLVTGVRADGGPRVEARRTPSMPAVFQAADGKANTITVTIQGDGGRNIERTFELSKEIRVSTGKKEDAQLSDLAAGMRITLLMSPDRRTIIGVKELVGEGDKPVERRPDGEKPADRKPDGDKPGDRKPERE